jgi:hypothetical protein
MPAQAKITGYLEKLSFPSPDREEGIMESSVVMFDSDHFFALIGRILMLQKDTCP